MSTFIQQTEGMQPVGIGNQKIINPDNSWIDTASRGVSSFLRAADVAGDVYAERAAKSAVSGAQEQLHSEIKEAQEYSAIQALGDDAVLREVDRKTSQYIKGIANGKITRENARVRVADLVTKSIEESPMFEDKIRSSAARLLGFDPNAEGFRQFFGVFEPAGTTAKAPTARELAVEDLMRTGLSRKNALDLIAQRTRLETENAIADEQLAADTKDINSWWTDEHVKDRIITSQDIISQVAKQAKAGEEVNANVWNSTIDDMEQRSWNALMARAQQAGKMPKTATERQKMKAEHEASYQEMRDFAKGKDSDFFRQDSLNRMATMYKTYGAEAMPVFTFLNTNYGDRFASRVIDLIDAAGGDKQQLSNLLSVSPGMAPLVDILNTDPKQFQDLIMSTTRKLSDPTATLTDEEKRTVTLLGDQIAGDNADPETKNQFATLAREKGLESTSSKVILRSSPSLATPENKTFVTNRWNTARGVLPASIIDKIEQHNTGSLTGRNARVKVTPTGLSLVINNPMRGEVQATSHPAWDDVQELNRFLSATNRGWGDVLGIKNPAAEAQAIADRVNNTLEGSVAAREAEASRVSQEKERSRAQSQEARQTANAPRQPLVDETARRERWLELKAKAALGE